VAATTVAAPDRPGRTAWLAVGLVLAVPAVLWGAFSVAGLLAYDAYDRHASFAGPVHVVDIDASAGGVRLTGSDRSGAVVDTHVIRGFTRPKADVSLADGRLHIHNTCGFTTGWCSVMSRVQVPSDVDVVVRSSGGSVRISGVTGDLDLSASGGGVHVTGSSGTLRLRSSGGGVDATGIEGGTVNASSSGGGVRLEFSRPPEAVVASSSGGGVTVVVPRDSTAYRVDAHSSGGGTHTDVRTDPTGRRRIDVSSSGGGVTVRYPD
jgi:hypothetical protein